MESHGLPGIAHGGIQPRIRDADDDIRLNGVLQRQKRARPLPGNVNTGPVNNGIGPGKIDKFKHAQPLFRLSTVRGVGADTVLIRHHDLAGADVPLKRGANGVQCAGLRGKDHGPVLQPPHAQWAEAMGSRTAMSFVGEDSTREYAPSMRFMAAETAASIEPHLSRSCTIR